jgi:hypothetical protein
MSEESKRPCPKSRSSFRMKNKLLTIVETSGSVPQLGSNSVESAFWAYVPKRFGTEMRLP